MDDYDGLVLAPAVPQFELHEFEGEDHLRLIALWKQRCVKWCMKTYGIARNDPCVCGSGKKLKKCCGAPDPRLDP